MIHWKNKVKASLKIGYKLIFNEVFLNAALIISLCVIIGLYEFFYRGSAKNDS